MFKIYFLKVTYGIAFYYLFTTNKLLKAISYNLRYLTVENRTAI